MPQFKDRTNPTTLDIKLATVAPLEMQQHAVGNAWEKRGQAVYLTNPFPPDLSRYAHETLTVSSTAVSLPLPKATTDVFLNYAYISVESNQVRFQIDPLNAPTASIGPILNVGDVLELHSADELQNIRFIRVSADATLQIIYGVIWP